MDISCQYFQPLVHCCVLSNNYVVIGHCHCRAYIVHVAIMQNCYTGYTLLLKATFKLPYR